MSTFYSRCRTYAMSPSFATVDTDAAAGCLVWSSLLNTSNLTRLRNDDLIVLRGFWYVSVWYNILVSVLCVHVYVRKRNKG